MMTAAKTLLLVGDYDPSVTLNVSMSPASYQAADYYDAVNRHAMFSQVCFY